MLQPTIAIGLGTLACAMVLAISGDVQAQAPRANVNVPVTPGVPDYRDPTTNRVWGPAANSSNASVNGAYDPLAQATIVQGTILQSPQVTQLGTVPITAGPTVPIVDLGSPTLQAVPGRRWQLVMYLNNNSGNTVTPVLTCRFTNSGQVVETTRATLPPIAGGGRVGFTVYGPKVTLYVDNSSCQVDQP